MIDITINDLSEICGYGTHINIIRADNGSVAINSVNCMKNSKDKRQQAKWEAFKDKYVYDIAPSVDMASIKRNGDIIRLNINAWIHSIDYEQAVAEYKKKVSRK